MSVLYFHYYLLANALSKPVPITGVVSGALYGQCSLWSVARLSTFIVEFIY